MKNEKLDKIGVSLSAICLFHCLLLPVLLATVPFMSFLSFLKTPVAEALLIIFAISNAILTVTMGFKKHKKFIVPAFFLSGAVMLSFFFFAHDLVEKNEYIILIGAALIGIGHIFNNSFCKSCKRCEINEQ
jgi:hypothetical protein